MLQRNLGPCRSPRIFTSRPAALPARRGEVFRLAVDPADLRLFGADGKAMEATPLPQPA